jgi:predicted transcriptional regulator
MTDKTMKIGIASYDDFKARTMAIARGEVKPGPDEPKVWFQSTESFAKVLSSRNRALLATIAETHPASLKELADKTGRKTSNLSRTLKTMARYGFVELHKDARGRIRPEVPFQAISLELAFH